MNIYKRLSTKMEGMADVKRWTNINGRNMIRFNKKRLSTIIEGVWMVIKSMNNRNGRNMV